MPMLCPTSAQLKRHSCILVSVSCEMTVHIQLGLFLCVYSCFSLFFCSLSYANWLLHVPSWAFFPLRALFPEFMTRSSSNLIRVLVRLSLYMFSVPCLCLSKPSNGSYCRPDLFAQFTLHISSNTFFFFFPKMFSHPRTNLAKPCFALRSQMRSGVTVVVWP